MKTAELKIEGMSCNHCVMAVKKELSKLENVKVEDVQIGSAKVEYDENKVDTKAFVEAIEEAGFKLLTHVTH
ncbi:MAG TPA: cation transporter [Ignavibacteriaceae bacterium]|nr:cation transporter [Ignavibacteriaceae bacterium]